MSRIATNELSNFLSTEIISYFLVAKKEVREGKKMYIRLELADKKGKVTANIWSNVKHFVSLFKEGDVIKVKAIVINYKGQVQLTVHQVKVAEKEDYDLEDFIQSSKKDIKEISDEFFKFVDSVEDEYLSILLKRIFDDREFFRKFAEAPAAKSWHHNYLHGLIEHSLSVARICDFSSKYYNVDRDLVVTAGLLHDIGKVYEYEMKTNIEFSTIGRLVGHISLGEELILKKIATINNFPTVLKMKLRHLILSHHGEFEKGSVRLPQ
ncbi:MAG: HD domain-containing protein, partial [Candidatus Cloacimonadota bacterium]|nr:HD domain-containing protein [Candidatus Cloacimonadota bacterium]